MATPPKILVIDDDVFIVNLIEKTLSKTGYQIIKAFDGEEALKTVEEEVPDLIILDLMIPKLPGEEVCKALRESFDEKLVKIPIIMLTGKDSMVDKILGKVIGANAYLTKPYDFSDLLEVIKKILPDS